MKVLGYARVSTEEQALSGLGIAAQKAAIEAECERRGWDLETVYVDDGVSGKHGTIRPAQLQVMSQVMSREVDGIMIAKLDRWCRSTREVQAVLEASTDRKSGFVFVPLDMAMVDTSTATGKLFATLVAAIAEWERDVISERTISALAAKKAMGVKLGRPRTIDPSTEALILELTEGMSYRKVARELTRRGIPTPAGRQTSWSHTTVAQVATRE